MEIDINSDLGESYGDTLIGNDDALFPYITSCNIACGFHGGDEKIMESTIRKAIEYDVQIGAHPSYPDRAGFGRRRMNIAPTELKKLILMQLRSLSEVAEGLGTGITYVKPHGALYNSIVNNEPEARVVIDAIITFNSDLSLMGLAGSPLQSLTEEAGLTFISEAFADRKYEPDGTLMSRSKEGSVLIDPIEAARQVLNIVLDEKVMTSDGSCLEKKADSICIHGDNPQAEKILKTIDSFFKQKGISKKRFANEGP